MENMRIQDVESGIHGAPAELVKFNLSPEERIAEAKKELKKILKGLKLTPEEMKRAFQETEEENEVRGNA